MWVHCVTETKPELSKSSATTGIAMEGLLILYVLLPKEVTFFDLFL